VLPSVMPCGVRTFLDLSAAIASPTPCKGSDGGSINALSNPGTKHLAAAS
jgi:hypothetical protein